MDNWLERTDLLLGREKLGLLKNARVLVVGLGGVGAYAAEMIARAGVGRMTIADADVVNVTNINRQLVAFHSTIGRSKADVLAERFGLTPAGARGQWEAAFDWDMSLLESSQQTFAQMSELQSRGLITGERLTQWVMGGTMDEARMEVQQAKAQQPDPMAGVFDS